jgi:hypothetical protein
MSSGYVIDWPLAIAALSLALSIGALVRDKFYFKGTEIVPLNTEQVHRIVSMEYRRLPRVTKDWFTNYPEAHPGFALFRIPWWNAGDRAGFVHVRSVAITSDAITDLKCAFYAYYDVGPEQVLAQPILIRNIPDGASATLAINVTYQWVQTSWLRRTRRIHERTTRLTASLAPFLTAGDFAAIAER